MRLTYLKPTLKDLSQGSRLSFVRQIRKLSQDNMADKLGLTGETKRRTIARYERGDRVPSKERLEELSNILNINIDAIKEYDFKNPIDFIYLLMWTEEIYPNLRIDLPITYYTDESLVIDIFLKNGKK